MSKPWYKLVTPREDLRENRPLDASEFAVHLDQVRDGRAPDVYKKPKEFFHRTYLTKNLTKFAAESVRRLSGEKTETSAVYNFSTQFGGGKTHALTLLYHLAKTGKESRNWPGVQKIIMTAGVAEIPKAETAVFVGLEFDSISGRGGEDGTPLRKTPWGEIAYQIGGEEGYKIVKKHDDELIAPAGDVIRKFLPKDKPCLILMDEVMNYVSRSRKSGLGAQLYNFIQSLSEEIRGRNNAVLAVSIPASELEMNPEDQADFTRLKKLLDRVGKPVMMSSESESSEIIRRRLFEWEGIPKQAEEIISAYTDWVIEHRQQLPYWFPVDNCKEMFRATYPFHPISISVFERKWRALPKFQQTRGMLRLLALWVAKAYSDGYKGAHKDSLITIGSAPLEDSTFRAAIFEQLNEERLEGAVTSDIAGKTDSHSIRLDDSYDGEIKKMRIHKKVATAIFFESNGGQTKDVATAPEIRLSVGGPEIETGNIETALDDLRDACYYLRVKGNDYRFSISPNLLKLHSDRCATIQKTEMEERLKIEIQNVFPSVSNIERVFFPDKSNDIPDRPALTFAIMMPDDDSDENKLITKMDIMTKDYGSSARSFKSAIIWCVPEIGATLIDDVRKVLAWEDIKNEKDQLKLDDSQLKQLPDDLERSKNNLKENIWRNYKNVYLLDKENNLLKIDLGLIHSSQSKNMVQLILSQLINRDIITPSVSPNTIIRNWPPAFKEWNTKSVRDVFYASPQFPRLVNSEEIKKTIATGVTNGIMAYVGKINDDEYHPFYFNKEMGSIEVEVSEDAYIITKETAMEYQKKLKDSPEEKPEETPPKLPKEQPKDDGKGKQIQNILEKIEWTGEVPPQKWTNFYTKILTKYATDHNLKLKVTFEVDGEIPEYKVKETETALRELGLDTSMVKKKKE